MLPAVPALDRPAAEQDRHPTAPETVRAQEKRDHHPTAPETVRAQEKRDHHPTAPAADPAEAEQDRHPTAQAAGPAEAERDRHPTAQAADRAEGPSLCRRRHRRPPPAAQRRRPGPPSGTSKPSGPSWRFCVLCGQASWRPPAVAGRKSCFGRSGGLPGGIPLRSTCRFAPARQRRNSRRPHRFRSAPILHGAARRLPVTAPDTEHPARARAAPPTRSPHPRRCARPSRPSVPQGEPAASARDRRSPEAATAEPEPGARRRPTR